MSPSIVHARRLGIIRGIIVILDALCVDDARMHIMPVSNLIFEGLYLLSIKRRSF